MITISVNSLNSLLLAKDQGEQNFSAGLAWKKTGSLELAASVEQSQSRENFEMICVSKVRMHYITEQQGWVAVCVLGTAFSIVDR